MDASVGSGGDSDLSESWTLIDKESVDPDEGITTEENATEASNVEILSEEKEDTGSTCEICETDVIRDCLPPNSCVKTPSEGAESVDSDGISVISESEEEELHLLPCNPPLPEAEVRSGSRLSNKYFDETDTSSQCSSRSHDFLGTEAEKKYVHQPNSALNTSLNVLLAIAFAAVLGLGMGHFMGIQEECSPGNALEDKVVNNNEKEELTALLLKKLELENTALKEQFANLQLVIEEIQRNNSASPCQNKYMHDDNMKSKVDNRVLDSGTMGGKCEVPHEPSAKKNLEKELPPQKKKELISEESKVLEGVSSSASPGGIPTQPDETTNAKDDVFPKLEKSFEDIASLFYSTLNGDKSVSESSQEAMTVAFSVLSSLMDNVQEKVSGLQKSMDDGTLNFDVPLKAISKMEDVIQKTSQKIQKVAKDALKEGQPLYTISNGITSKLQTINKKLEHKWCQIKKNLSKQSALLSWLDNQIFHNCSKEEGEYGATDSEADINLNGYTDSMEDMQLKSSALGAKKRKFETKGLQFEKYINANGKKAKTSIKDEDLKSKDRNGKNDYKWESPKGKFKNGEFRDPNAFDFDYIPKKGKNKDSRPARMEGKRRKVVEAKNGDGSQYGNEGEYNVMASGEWVEAMFNSRAERRRDERRSDWIFARARSRSKSREAHPSRWYARRGEEKL